MTWWFNARMIPMRANIAGPPRSATTIKASIAACHSGAAWTAFGSLVMKSPASRKVRRVRPSGRAIGSSKRRAPTLNSHCNAQTKRPPEGGLSVALMVMLSGYDAGNTNGSYLRRRSTMM